MTAIECISADDISTSQVNGRAFPEVWEQGVDTGEKETPLRWLRAVIRAITATPGTAAGEDEWLGKTIPRLDELAELPSNWDGEGSQSPNPDVVAAAKGLLARLRGSQIGAVPVPFVSPIGGGGFQFEWTSSDKHLEIEFLDASTIVFLKERVTPQGDSMESGEYRLENVELTRRLLDWFATI